MNVDLSTTSAIPYAINAIVRTEGEPCELAPPGPPTQRREVVSVSHLCPLPCLHLSLTNSLEIRLRQK